MPSAPHPTLRWFDCDHLPTYLEAVAEPFRDLAHALAEHLPASAETSAFLRHLLESKDAAVRAAILKYEAEAAAVPEA